MGGGAWESTTPSPRGPSEGWGERMAKSAAQRGYKQNRLQQLRGFCAAAQTESVSKAAERMFLSQPSVSLQIQALERELHAELFERRGPRIALTPEGKTLYELASPLVEAIDSLEDTFASRRGQVEKGRLDIAAGESTILYILPGFVQQFCSQFPAIELKLHNVTGRDGVAMLRADEVDFAVGPNIEGAEDIEYQELVVSDPMLICAPTHPLAKKKRVTIKDVADHPLILPPRHLATWRVVDFVFQKHKLSYRVNLEAGGWEVIKRYVALGLGISIVASICLTGDEPLTAIPVSRYFPRRSYGMLVRKGKFLTPQAERFLAVMQSTLSRK